MSLETVAIAAAPKILSSFAAPIAKALGQNLTFRLRIWNAVRKHVSFQVPLWGYLTWLKSLSESEISSPVEHAGSDLTQRLDDCLTRSRPAWAEAPDHLSRAAQLMEASFPALVSRMGDARGALVTATWMQSRGLEVRRMLLEVVGPEAALSHVDRAQLLFTVSAARRNVRLRSFGLAEYKVGRFLESIKPPSVPSGSVRVLTGDFGSGKSEVAESWHRQSITRLGRQAGAPAPVWINAYEIPAGGLLLAVEQRIGRNRLATDGAAVVVDGLDEATPAVATKVLDEGRILATSNKKCSVLITVRPGVVTPAPDELINVALLPAETAAEIVETLAGQPYATHAWSQDLDESIRRPFFALAAGTLIASGVAVNRDTDLVRSLVEKALARGTERTTLTTSETRGVLLKLAKNLTEMDFDALTFSERLAAKSSRLVADRADGSVYFSLPIFQQWFAAEALRDGSVMASVVVASPADFARWRWAAAIVIQSASSAELIDSLMTVWVKGNPGAASWLLYKALGERTSSSGSSPSADQESAESRVHIAFRSWIESLGDELGELAFPEGIGPSGINLGIKVSGNYICLSVAKRPLPGDRVCEGPKCWPLDQLDPESEWFPWTMQPIAAHVAWPWVLVWSKLPSSLNKILRFHPQIGDENSVWVQERQYQLAVDLVGGNYLTGDSVLGSDLVERLDGLLTPPSGLPDWDPDSTVFKLSSGREFAGWELRDLQEKIQDGVVDIDNHLPKPDQLWSGPYFTSSFSDSRLLEYVVEVFARAAVAYDEALDNLFAKFGWSLFSSSISPYGTILVLDTSDHPTVNVRRLPMALLADTDLPNNAVWARNRRAAGTLGSDSGRLFGSEYAFHFAHLTQWFDTQGVLNLGGISVSTSIVDSVRHRRPASTVAANWLHDDLKNLGLASGILQDLT